MKTFSKEFRAGDFEVGGYTNPMFVTLIESTGNDLDDLLCNGCVYYENSGGEPASFPMDIGELDTKSYEAVSQMLVEFLATGAA